ncbi:MAG: TIM barrel protein [Oscillospiraceae bacterium]|nr:TIM barrel protein [Oscillospiraceae bacterium]
MPISFGPGGNSDSFTNAKKRFPEDLPEYLRGFGLNAYEIECGRGVNISAKMYAFLPELATENNIEVTLHTPYYISLSSEQEEIRQKSANYILQSAEAAMKLGARKIVVHSGSCAKMSREEALALAKETLKKSRKLLIENNLSGIIICPETMGKINQLGTLEEVIELCKVDESFLPCVDFGHLNARSHGGIKTKSDYRRIFDTLEDELGFKRAQNLHIHFSKIQYTEGGEKTHLTFTDTEYGPDYEPLMEVIAEQDYQPSIICESDGTQAEDAQAMKEYYKRFIMGGFY